MSELISLLENSEYTLKKQEQLLWDWAHINSGSLNVEGLNRQREAIYTEFKRLNGESKEVTFSPLIKINEKGEAMEWTLANGLSICKRPQAPIQVFLFGHMDTVFGKDHPFQSVEKKSENIWRGPGVSDLKGGILVILRALQILENSPYKENLGWEVFLNSDEEMGSPGSASYFESRAAKFNIGLGFEPSQPDGRLVAARKGSGNFTLVIKGRSSHVGRSFHEGRSAHHRIVEFFHTLLEWGRVQKDVIINLGQIEGGGPVNVVSDLAIGRFNIRVETIEMQKKVEEEIQSLIERENKMDGIQVKLWGAFSAPPKPFEKKTQAIAFHLKECGRELNINLDWVNTGGVCDGNRLAAAGLPNMDTLGAVGGMIHTDQEYIELDSLQSRSNLVGLYLIKLATGAIKYA